MLVAQTTCKRGSTSDMHVCVKKWLHGVVNFISFYAGAIDPGTPRSPSWKVTPKSNEIAVEGRNKTIYCLAVGRRV